ncbi:hypothetical protein CEXT_416951 [Caerostris extrusa]|uniref:Uncharacterized protein n=1 Tax=Caerostris extrusa TaxID=172846 RepID=A0AAV4SIH7_CAEEX|nr:hypothetical protein CEXT_416951 [Caerostris extrusa]
MQLIRKDRFRYPPLPNITTTASILVSFSGERKNPNDNAFSWDCVANPKLISYLYTLVAPIKSFLQPIRGKCCD